MSRLVGARDVPAEDSSLDETLDAVYKYAMQLVARLESGEIFPKTPEFKTMHLDAITALVQCIDRVHQLGLFSPNESMDDIQTPYIKYLNLNFYVAKVLEKSPINPSQMSVSSRISMLNIAAHRFLEFLFDVAGLGLKVEGATPGGLVSYVPLDEVLPQGKYGTADLSRVKQKMRDRRLKTDIASRLRAATRTLETARTDAPVHDEEKLRAVEAARIVLHWYSTWDSMVGVVTELELLTSVSAAAPEDAQGLSQPGQEPPLQNPSYVPHMQLPGLVMEWEADTKESMTDLRTRIDSNITRDMSTQIEPASNGLDGERLVGPDGKLRRPFVIAPQGNLSRLQVSQSIFGTGQRLPTVSIEELVEKELANQVRPDTASQAKNSQEDDDSDRASDARTMKARHWDEFTENNPRGSGNTLNLG